MALSIGTNNAAINASTSYSSVSRVMEKSYANLATGKRINVASDDAAGVAISSRLSAEIRGIDQAIRNAIDGQALLDIAEGVQQEVQNILQRMREITVQSANDTNNQQDRNNLQVEMNHMIYEIDRISTTTTWAGKSLIDDLADTKFSLQVGASANKTDKMDVSISSLSSTSLGLAISPIAEPVSVGANGLLNYQAANGGAFEITTAEGTMVNISAKAGDASASEYAIAVAADINRGTGFAATDFIIGDVNAPLGYSGHGLTASVGEDGTSITLTYTGAISRVDPGGTLKNPTKVHITNFFESHDTTYTITGLDTNGQPITETLSGSSVGGYPGPSTTTTFSSIESIYADTDTGEIHFCGQDATGSFPGLVRLAEFPAGDLPLLVTHFINSPGFESSSIHSIDNLTFASDPVLATLSSISISKSGYRPAVQGGEVTEQFQGGFSDSYQYTVDSSSKILQLNNGNLYAEVTLTGANSETRSVIVDYTNEESKAKSIAEINEASSALNLGYAANLGLAGGTHGDNDVGRIVIEGNNNSVQFGPISPIGWDFSVDQKYGTTLEARDEVAATSDGSIDAITGVFTLAVGKQEVTITLAGIDVAVSGLTGDGGSAADAGAIALAVNNSTDAHRFTAKASDDGTVTIKPPVYPTSVADGTESRESTGAIDDALKLVATQRVELGAASNSLNHTIDNLTNISVNLSQARGGIEDADFAIETMRLAKAQILQQASTAMLAQANASKQNILSLLQE